MCRIADVIGLPPDHLIETVSEEVTHSIKPIGGDSSSPRIMIEIDSPEDRMKQGIAKVKSMAKKKMGSDKSKDSPDPKSLIEMNGAKSLYQKLEASLHKRGSSEVIQGKGSDIPKPTNRNLIELNGSSTTTSSTERVEETVRRIRRPPTSKTTTKTTNININVKGILSKAKEAASVINAHRSSVENHHHHHHVVAQQATHTCYTCMQHQHAHYGYYR